MKVRYNSPLERRGWVQDGLLEKSSQSFWLPYTGNTANSIVYQRNDSSCVAGQTVIFDFSSFLTGKAYKGDDYSYGKGEVKRKFSDGISVEEISHYVANGSAFDGCIIDDLESTTHSDSRSKLGDLFIRHKDQNIFDVVQGASLGNNITHIFNLGDGFTYGDLKAIENAVKRGKGLMKPTAKGAVSNTKAMQRSPLKAFRTEGGQSIYLVIVDTYMATELANDPKYQTIISDADVRGNNNRLIDGKIGRIGNTIYVESPVFVGATEGSGQFTKFDNTPEQAGLRRYATTSTGKVVWEGQEDFNKVEELLEEDTTNGNTTNADAGNAIYSRGVVLGAGAVQQAFGKMPDYKVEFSAFEKTSESMLEYWANVKKTVLTREAGSKYVGNVEDIDFSTIAIDMKHKN